MSAKSTIQSLQVNERPINLTEHVIYSNCIFECIFSPTDEESLEDSDEEEHHYNPIIPKTLPPAQPPQNLKRSFPPCGLNLGPEISFKKFKTDEKTTPPSKPTPKSVVNPPHSTPISKNEKPTNSTTSATFEDEDEHNLSDDDLSYYDSDLESEGELQDLGSDLGLSLNVGEGVKNTEAKTSGLIFFYVVCSVF